MNVVVGKVQLAVESSITVVVLRVMLAVLPFPSVVRLVGVGVVTSVTADESDAARAPAELELRRLGAYVERVSTLLLPDRPCLLAALAAHVLLRRRGRTSVVVLGVARAGEERLRAHAWSLCERDVVTGRRTASRYAPLCRLESGHGP